jgi:hypothetical protein
MVAYTGAEAWPGQRATLVVAMGSVMAPPTGSSICAWLTT